MSTATQEVTRCPEASEAILRRLSKLLDDASSSDFIIKCSDREWKVHRLVLTLHSTVLAAACWGGFKEEKEQIIDLGEEDADCVGAFVHYMYNLNYDAAKFRGSGDRLSLHVQMYVLADKYDMTPLRDLAFAKFQNSIDEGLPTTSDLANAAMCAYDAVGPTIEIRKIIVALAVNQNLVPSEITAEPMNEFENAMEQYPRLCVDIAKIQQSMIKRQLTSLTSEVRGSVSKAPKPGCRCSQCRQEYYLQSPRSLV